MNTVKEKAYAKINLCLDVIAKRDDGFHDIRTIMHSVSLFDEISVSSSRANSISIKLDIEGDNYLPVDEKNLAFRAAKLFLSKAGICADVKITLKKNIPISAGLAGGSSDAAAVLRALNRIYKKPFTLKALANIGAEIGSDVPYCVFGKTALCEGRGEKITLIPAISKYNIVLVSSCERVSTPAAYEKLDSLYDDFSINREEKSADTCKSLIEELLDGKIPEACANIFEQAVLPDCPRALLARKRLLELGASVSMMSGSGATIFGIYKTKNMADKAKQKMNDDGYMAWSLSSV